MSRQHPESLCPRYEGRVGEEFNPSSWHLIKSPKMLFCGTQSGEYWLNAGRNTAVSGEVATI